MSNSIPLSFNLLPSAQIQVNRFSHFNLGCNFQEEFVYLFEDALDLWEEAVKNAPTEVKEAEPMTGPEYNFIGLFPRAIACLQFGSENLKKILRIIESYLILDPVGIMQVTAPFHTRLISRDSPTSY